VEKTPPEETRLEREATLAQLASAYQRRELGAFERAVLPDMTLTLAGSSRLAGTYEGYGAFGRYLEVLREILRSAGKPITFTHDEDEMVFRQVMVVSGPQHATEMTLVVTVRYDEAGKIRSFLVEPEDQRLFDHLVDTSSAPDLSS
jgi:ketosteroid isomerase-like protein